MISYGLWPWLLFLLLAILLPYFLRLPGLALTHLIVTVVIVYFDNQWMDSQMAKPGQSPDTGPDRDFVFLIGVIFRVLLINSFLLPLGLLSCHLRARRLSRDQKRNASGPTPLLRSP
jgi:hypothetical protein